MSLEIEGGIQLRWVPTPDPPMVEGDRVHLPSGLPVLVLLQFVPERVITVGPAMPDATDASQVELERDVYPVVARMLSVRLDWCRRFGLDDRLPANRIASTGQQTPADQLNAVGLHRLWRYARYMTHIPRAINVLGEAYYQCIEAAAIELDPSPMLPLREWQQCLRAEAIDYQGPDRPFGIALSQVMSRARYTVDRRDLMASGTAFRPMIRALYFPSSRREYDRLARHVAMGAGHQSEPIGVELSSPAELGIFLPAEGVDVEQPLDRLAACITAALLGFECQDARDMMLGLGPELTGEAWRRASSFVDQHTLPELLA